MTFLAPWLLIGLALASVPLLIHMLHRRRFTLVEWAPMHYLKLTLKSNRRRFRLEQWLLLALRTLAVVALVLALAQPMVAGSGLGGWLAGAGRTARVVVVDDTLSMGYRHQDGVAFEHARTAAGELIERIGTQDSLTLLTASAPHEPMVRHGHVDDAEPVLTALGERRVTDMAAHWPTTLRAVDEHLSTAAFEAREVTLVTDLRASGWTAEVAEVARTWAQAGVAVRVVDVGREAAGNVTLLEMQPQSPVALVDQPTTLLVRLRNDGPEAVAVSQAVLTVDGVARTVELPELPAGEVVEMTLPVRFDEPGRRMVRLSLPEDGLPGDNHRWLVVDVRRSLEVLLVDGRPGLRPFESATDFVALALASGPTPWRVRRLVDSEWLDAPMTAPDVLVLADVATIPPERVALIEAQVEAGMGLMIFPGEQVEPATYNEALYSGSRRLLPARLEAVRGGGDAGMTVDSRPGSLLHALSRLSAGTLAAITPRQFVGVSLPGGTGEQEADGGHVLARWNDADRSPAAVERQLGDGRVLLWTVTADRAWSDWPTEPSYVLAMREATMAMVASTAHRHNLVAGETVRVRLDAHRLPSRVSVKPPDSAEPAELVPASPATDGPGDAEPVPVRFGRTPYAGAYEMQWVEPGGHEQVHRFAVNPDTRDSDLARLAPEQLEQWFEGGEFTVVRLGDVSATRVTGVGRALWRFVVAMLLAVLLCETVVAAWVGRER